MGIYEQGYMGYYGANEPLRPPSPFTEGHNYALLSIRNIFKTSGSINSIMLIVFHTVDVLRKSNQSSSDA